MTDEDRALRIKGLRDMLDWLEDHPEVKVPYALGRILMPLSTKEQLQTFARAAGRATRRDDSSYTTLTKEFPGGVELAAYVPRGEVCRPKVKEVVEVPAAEAYTYERVTEWECIPILSDEEVSAV